MNSPEKALAQRLKELRRRHFGPRGKALFAERLGVALDDYTRYERGVLPPGDVLVRVCEATGEDLQWLLTGVASRETVIIAGARGRHRNVLARLARLLDEKPERATAIEAFLDLLLQGERVPGGSAPALPEPEAANLIRIYEPDELPLALPETPPEGGARFDLARLSGGVSLARRVRAELAEPNMEYAAEASQTVDFVTMQDADGHICRCVNSAEIARCFPAAFGVRLADDTMQPMFRAGDAVIVAPGSPPKVGQPVLCRLADEPEARCRIWLGAEGDAVQLGRLADGELEQVDREAILWSLEALYRLAIAA